MTECGAPHPRVMVKQELRDDYEEMCRLCVARSPEYFSIVTENLPELLFTHLGVSISESDNWPKFICSGCLEKVHEVIRFISTIRESENVLKDLFGERETDPRGVSDTPSDHSWRVKEERLPESSSRMQDSGILRQMLLGEISKCSYIAQKPPVPPQSTSLLRDQLLKPLQPRPRPTFRPLSPDLPARRRRRRRIWSPEDTEVLHVRIESFYKLQCDVCKQMFGKFRDLEDHFRDIHSRKAYIPCCKLKFSGLTNLSDHLHFHANPEAFKCLECGKCFKYQCSLDFHTLNTHTPHEMRPFSCPSCPQRFVTGKMLKQHAMVHVASEEKRHSCPHCRRAFERKASMRKHIRTFHEGGANIICQVCGVLFRDAANLERHESTHRESEHTVCPICGKILRHKYNLASHIRLHTNSEEIFECHLCGKSFPHKDAMRAHITYVHLKKKTHKCLICRNAYKTLPELKQHVAMHTGEANLQCRFCSRMFVTRSQRCTHEKSVHPGEYEATVLERRIEKIDEPQ